jgi:hypothetical protein
MQLSFKTVAAAVVLALGSTTSALAVETTSTGNSSLFITVFDPVLGASVVQDLGLNYADFLRSTVATDDGFLANFSVDMSVFSQVGSNGSDLRYSIFAGDALGNYTSTEVIGTAALGALGATISGINSNVVGMLGSSGAANVFAQWNNTCGTSSTTCVGTAFGSTYFGNFADDFNGLPVPAAGAVGSALGFYSLRRSSPGAQDALVSAQYANSQHVAQWLLNADGSLSYTLPAVVPLPAAIWLLLSSLAGLGVVGRRKAA